MSNRIIKLNRGDSYEFSLSAPKLVETRDAVYFALMYPNQPFEEAYLIQGYTAEDQDEKTGEITIQLAPNDTRKLSPGIYYYTVKLQRGGSLDFINDADEPIEVKTLIERTKFIINE